jgi:hypothetical protein
MMLLAACQEVTFQVPQPAGVSALKEIPPVLQGAYRAADDSDTLVIDARGYRLKDATGRDWLGRGTLSDTLIVKEYQGYYFVNFKADQHWVLRVLKVKPAGLSFLAIELGDSAQRQATLKRISKVLTITEVHSESDGDIFYLVNPTPAQLMQLIKNGVFTTRTLEKMQ